MASKKKYTLLAAIPFLVVGCIGFDYDYMVCFMSSKKLTYNELPVKVQKCLVDYPINLLEYPLDSTYYDKGMLLVDDSDSSRFQCELVETGPWIDYEKIIDSEKNIVYRIETAAADPHIIYKNKLYIPDRYNILGRDDAREAMYKEYELK